MSSGTIAMAAGTLKERYRAVQAKIAAAAKRSGREPDDVILVAVTKTAEMDEIRELLELGHIDFGESRVPQLIQRAAMLEEIVSRRKTLPGLTAARREERLLWGDRDESSGARVPDRVRWHMIGHLQRNKVKKILPLVRLIHSVDSLRLVEEIQAAAIKRDQVIDVLVQVNTSGEKSKFGCAVAAAPHLIDQINTMIHLRVRGMMTMAPMTENQEVIRSTFERCRDLFQEIRLHTEDAEHFNILSMGMSHDYELAIECGSNCVRIGTAIFGDRQMSDDESGGDS